MARLPAATSRIDWSQLTSSQPTTQPPPLSDCNFLRLLAHSPAATAAYAACEAALRSGQLTARQREQIALAVAEINGSKYGLSAHYAAAKQSGLSEEEIRFARRATAPDPKTDAMLRFAQGITLQRGDLSDADFLTLRRTGISESLIGEIVANVALNIFANYFNTVTRTDVDFPLLKPGYDGPVAAEAPGPEPKGVRT
jgi:uncharacterized peroxidase-related enzyme